MSINNIQNANEVNLSGVTQISQSVKNVAIQEEITKKATREDTFEKSKELTKDETGIYSRESILAQLKDSEEQRIKAFEDTIRSMVAQQGETINLTFRGLDLHVTEEESAEATKSIEEGGTYSVENVSDRIMKMAKALAGDDPTKIDILRDAVIKGFEGATGLLGKNSLEDMPEITNKTYENVMKQFDDWKNSYNQEVTEQANVENNVATAYQAVDAVKIAN